MSDGVLQYSYVEWPAWCGLERWRDGGKGRIHSIWSTHVVSRLDQAGAGGTC